MAQVNISEIPNSWKSQKLHIHSLHKMCSRICSFPPPMITYFINQYSKPNDVILDSFSGKGTTPLEACILGRVGIGSDVSPEAFVLTHAKVNPVSLKALEKGLEELKKQMHALDEIKAENDLDRNARIFYSKSTFEQVLKARELLKDKNDDFSIFVKALMCGILHGSSQVSLSLPSSHSFSMSPTYVKNYAKKHKLRRPKRDLVRCIAIKAKEVLKDKQPEQRGIAYMYDARNLGLDDSSIDLAITSPPYFNLGTYAWNNWLRLWFLGYDYREVRKQQIETGSEEKYEKFMEESFIELERVLKNNARCFVVVGDVKLKDKVINTAEFLSKSAKVSGFKVERIIEDPIPKHRKHFTYLKPTDGIKLDRVLCLKKS